MKDDWRLCNQMEYLYDVVLIHTVFQKTEKNDHEHCEFCMASFSEYSGDLHAGYCTLNRYHWICEECYRDFKDMFKWKLVAQ